MQRSLIYLKCAVFLTAVAIFPTEGQNLCCTNVTTYHNDSLRTGWNSTETVLTPANVNATSFGALATVTLDDQVDAQPLVVTNQVISGQGMHSVVYVVTENNTVYAIDASSGAILLTQNLGPSVPKPLACDNNGPNVGINSTPVIDIVQGAIYVIAYTIGDGGPTYTIHKLSLSALTDLASPVVITATHTLNNGTVYTFNATYQRQRTALLEANGNIYAGFGSFCDYASGKSRGWVLGWSSATLAPLANNQLNDTQAAQAGSFLLSSVWMSGYGIAADAVGDIYFSTGNSNTVGGNPPPTTYDGLTNIQESIVKMQEDLSRVLDLFTPNNVATLDQKDEDYGSGGVLLLPDQPGTVPHWAVAAGKDGRLFILNRDSMGGFHNPDIPSYVNAGVCWCGPSYYEGSDGIGRIITSGGHSAISWKVNTAGQSPALTVEVYGPKVPTGPQDGGFFTSISSNGTLPNSTIVWAVARPSGTADYVTLYAYNAHRLTQLWSGPAGTWPNTGSAQSPTTITGNANIVPTVANGRVYVASYQQLWIFGLKGSSTKTPWAIVNQASNIVAPGSGLTIPSTGSGNLISVAMTLNGSTSVTDVSDNAGNSYVSAGAASSMGQFSTEIWYASNSKPGATVVTPQFASSPTHLEMTSWEVSGFATVARDAKNTASGNVASNNTAGAPVTTSQPGDFIVSVLFAGSANFTNISTRNEFTNDFATNGNGWAHITSNSAVAGVHQASWYTAAPNGIFSSSTVAFCSCTPASSPWAIVNKASNTISAGAGLSIPATGSGNLIAIALMFNGSTSVNSISDNAGNTYVSAGAPSSTGQYSTEIWYAANSRPGANLVTPKFNGSPAAIEMTSWEVSGVASGLPDAVNAASGNVVSSNTAGPPVTTQQAGDFIISVLFATTANLSGMSTGNEFTDDFTTNGNGWAHVTNDAASIGTHQASWYTSAPSGTYCASTVAFRPLY